MQRYGRQLQAEARTTTPEHGRYDRSTTGKSPGEQTRAHPIEVYERRERTSDGRIRRGRRRNDQREGRKGMPKDRALHGEKTTIGVSDECRSVGEEESSICARRVRSMRSRERKGWRRSGSRVRVWKDGVQGLNSRDQPRLADERIATLGSRTITVGARLAG